MQILTVTDFYEELKYTKKKLGNFSWDHSFKERVKNGSHLSVLVGCVEIMCPELDMLISLSLGAFLNMPNFIFYFI